MPPNSDYKTPASPACKNCAHFKFDKLIDYKGWDKEKNMRCVAQGGFKTIKTGLCYLYVSVNVETVEHVATDGS